MNSKILDHYLQFSQYTDPGLYRDLLINLPSRIEDFGLLIRKQLIHCHFLEDYYDIPAPILRSVLGTNESTKIPWHRQCEDDNFPTVAAILAELYRRNSAGFVPDRAPKDKLILTCRFIAIMVASILKSKNIPARCRSGLAPYFKRFNGQSVPHWINQFWNNKEKRWVTIDVDASLDNLPFNPYDMPEGVFDFPAKAWLNVRTGKEDGQRFCHWRINNFPVLALIAEQLFHDFYCFMNCEVIYLHIPEKIDPANFAKLTGDELKEIDQLAYLMQNPDENFDKLREIWEMNKGFRLLKGGLLLIPQRLNPER